MICRVKLISFVAEGEGEDNHNVVQLLPNPISYYEIKYV